MSWPLIIGIIAGVVVTDIRCQRIKRNAKKEEKNELFNFKNKLPSVEMKDNPVLPDELKKVKVKKIKE